MAFSAAKVDERIVGLGLLDFWSYRTPRYYWQRIRPRLFKASAWLNSIKVRLPSKANANTESTDGLDLPTYVREYPQKRDAKRDLAQVLDRGVSMRCIFSGGLIEEYNHEGQFRSAFSGVDFGDLLEERFLSESDHIFTNLAHQQVVIDDISAWLESRWSSDAQQRRGLRAA
jgi:hypothetical protein